MSFPQVTGALLALLSLMPGLTLVGQVIINEVSSVQSDRLLQHPAGGVPRLGNLPAWHEPGFSVPTWWQSSPGSFGFGYAQATNVQAAMQGKSPVLYMRRDFTATAAQAGSGESLELVINYDDGFVAYLNGVEIARRNTGAVGSFAWHDQTAFNIKSAAGAETIVIGPAAGRLRPGANVFAVQVHNHEESAGGLLCEATLRLAGPAPSTFVIPSDGWRWFVGTHEPAGGLYDPNDFGGGVSVGPNWTQLEYADASWSQGAGSVGYDTGADYGPQLRTNLLSMRNVAVSLYMRREFTLTQVQFDGLTSTSLTVDWDDGYALYLNGFEVSRANLGGSPGTFIPFTQTASNHPASRDDGSNNPGAIGSISIPKNLLRVGRNVISGQVHNSSVAGSDLLLDVRFSGVSSGSTITFVSLGSMWRFRVGTSEIATPPPATTQLVGPEFLDWIELKNSGSSAVDVSGWALTDSSAEPALWRFPTGTSIGGGGFLLVACSGRDVAALLPGGLHHTNFSLNSKGEYLALTDAGGAIQSVLVNVPDQDAFHTWGIDAAGGEYRYLERGTPGAENGGGASTDIVSEVSFDKPSGFHPRPLSVTLSTETPGSAIRYTLDGSDPTSATGIAYTGPFDPTAPRPSVGPGTGTILREFFQWTNGVTVLPQNLPANATPTSSSLITQLETPSSVSDYYTHRVRGFIHPPQTGNYEFWIATDDEGELWLSTTDSPSNKRRIAFIQAWTSSREWTRFATQKSVSIPLVAGQRYYVEALQSEGSGGDNCAVGWSGPGLPAGINVVEGRYLSPPATLPPGTLTPIGGVTVRARAFAANRLASEVRTRNYVTGADARVAAVPAFFLSGPDSETFYAGNGIFSQVGGSFNDTWSPNDARFDYNFAIKHGDAFERPAALEIINPGNQLVERTTVGVRFSGSPYSRPRYNLQNVKTGQWISDAHSKPQINLFFRGDFGISKLKETGFIPTSKLNEWDELRLRAGKNDAFNPFIIDEWMRRTFAGMGAPSPQGFLATVFINGHLKSFFNPTERVREPFFREFYKSDNAWDVNYIGEWESGDTVAFEQMRSFFLNNDFTTFANYQQGAAYWDMENVADYFIVNGWAATGDWPGNNYAFARERAVGAKWRFSMWDAEGAFGMFGQPNTHNTFEQDLLVPENGARSPAIRDDYSTVRFVFRRAYQSPEFRLLFADRLQRHFFNGGPMTRANMQARWTGLRATVEPLIAAMLGGSFNSGPWDSWANRDSLFLQQCRTLNLWPATLAPSVSPAGGTIGPGNTVAISNPNGSGSIYYTKNGTDPRAVGGGIAGTLYSTPLAVTSPLTLKARVLSAGNEWSPLREADFAPPPQRLLITEINYNPAEDDDLKEFLELTNVSDESISLNGAHFTAGITYDFGDVTLLPGERFVLVRNAIEFARAYPGVPIGGVFGGALANEGETLTLRDVVETIIVTVTYGDNRLPDWPAIADGGGYSLVLKRPLQVNIDPSLPVNWRGSAILGGAPGASDSTVFVGDPAVDGDFDGHLALIEYGMGTSDADPSAFPQLIPTRMASGQLQVSLTRAGEADDVTIEAFESVDTGSWQPATLVEETPVIGGRVRSVWRSSTSGPQVFLRVRVTRN